MRRTEDLVESVHKTLVFQEPHLRSLIIVCWGRNGELENTPTSYGQLCSCMPLIPADGLVQMAAISDWLSSAAQQVDSR